MKLIFLILKRFGEHGPTFKYPEWLIMFIAILSVKLKVKTYIQIHKMALKYWDIIAEDFDITRYQRTAIERLF
jgi:hypothetical protein